MKQILHAAVAATLLAVPVQAASVSDPYSSFFVLGDSLSDNGSVLPQAAWLGATGGAPYFDRPNTAPLPGQIGNILLTPSQADPTFEEGGTFSNGEVWVQPLIDDFLANGKLAVNYAIGGATTGATSAGPAGFDLPQQSQLAAANIVTGAAGARPLVSVWFGGNDVFDAFGSLTNPFVDDLAPVFTAATDAAFNVIGTVATLIDAPFGVNDFIVGNLPDLSLIPAYREITSAAAGRGASNGLATFAADVTALFNQTLASGLATLRANGANIALLDANGLLTAAAQSPGDFGYTNVTDACVTSKSVCTNVTEFLFIDSVHPTAGAHAAIGAEAVAALTPVPLPAGVWLMLAGLGALALRRRAT